MPRIDVPGEHETRVDDRPASGGPVVEAHDAESRCLVVMYHYVRDTASDPWVRETGRAGVRALSPAQFRAQVEELCRTMEPIDWPRFYAWRKGRHSIARRSFLLTFDDGLADHWRGVVPILESLGLRGTFFVPGVVLTGQHLLAAHATQILLNVLDEEGFERELWDWLLEKVGPEARSRFPLDAHSAEALYHYETPPRARLKYLLTMVLPSALRIEAVHALFERHVGSPRRWAKEWYLGWAELTSMQRMGHTIGGHGFLHEPYTNMSLMEARADLGRIATVLRAGLGPDRRPFSYPFGRFDRDIGRACKDAGFAEAFTTEEAWVRSRAPAHALPRVDTIRVGSFLPENTL